MAMQKRAAVEEANVRVVPYDPEWPRAFCQEAALLKSALGDKLVGIEHFGSTSVPGLAAKPIIDILVAKRSGSEPDHSEIAMLVGLGYEWLGQDGRRPDRWMLRKRGSENFNLSFVPAGSDLWRDNLLVRNLLCASPEEARAYAVVKQRAAELSPNSLLGYQNLKRAYVEKLVFRAREYRESKQT
jgi:GrpB-like predicted nucleotidyltransferase (UPF0157 family)